MIKYVELVQPVGLADIVDTVDVVNTFDYVFPKWPVFGQEVHHV